MEAEGSTGEIWKWIFHKLPTVLVDPTGCIPSPRSWPSIEPIRSEHRAGQPDLEPAVPELRSESWQQKARHCLPSTP